MQPFAKCLAGAALVGALLPTSAPADTPKSAARSPMP